MPDYIKKMMFLFASFVAVFFIILNIIKDKEYEKVDNIYTVKAYKNTVALYKNDEIIKTYDSIVLNTLPQGDIENFKSGIRVSSPTEAEIMLEDYDG